MLAEYSRATNVDWQEIPADIATFIDDPTYSDFGTFLWPNVKLQLIEIGEAYERGVRDICVEEPIGTGKSEAAACLGAWLLHRLLCMRDPQRHFKIAEGNYLTVLNMSRSRRQAREIVFHRLANRIKRSEWFKSRGYLPDPKIKSELRFKKGIVCFPGNSKEETALGYDIIYAVLDEANRFVLRSGVDNANEVFDELQRRISSRFLEYDEGCIFSMSSSTHDLSFTRRKEEEAVKSPQTVFYRRKDIHQLWPETRLRNLVKFEYGGATYMIPVKLLGEFKRNPPKAARDYFCVAMAGEQPYMPPYQVLEATVEGGVNAWDDVRAWPVATLRPQEWGDVRRRRMATDGRPRYIHIDLGATGDACGIAMACLEGTKVLGGVIPQLDGTSPTSGSLAILTIPREERPVVRLDFAGRIEPRQHGGEVDFSEVRRIVYWLRDQGFNIAKVTYDGWQSTEALQQLKRKGFTAEVQSVDRDEVAYETLKECILEGRLRWQAYEVLLRELSRLQRVRVGKIDHPRDGSKDVADAVAGAVFLATQNVGDWRVTWLQEVRSPRESIAWREPAQSGRRLVSTL